MLIRTTLANAPSDFILLGQKYNNQGMAQDDLCGTTEQAGFTEITSADMATYEQRCLPGTYGNHISYIDYLKVKLQEIDLESVRPLRAIANETGTEYDTAKVVELETKASAYRAEIQAYTPIVVEEVEETPTE